MKWTSEDEAVLTRMWREQGKTLGQIGDYFGVSRSAAGGKVSRLGLQKNRDANGTRAEFRSQSIKARVRKAKGLKMKKPKKPKLVKGIKVPPMVIAEPILAPTSKPVALLSRKTSQCSYMVGPQMCCGSMIRTKTDAIGRVVSTSWCPYHYKLVYRDAR